MYVRISNWLCSYILVQISGEKHLTLFDPHHNGNLYEAHIPEAILSFIPSNTSKFHRNTLLESTSMVMSPVDIQEPDLERFPNFAKARRVHCVLRPGNVLFMPAYWWHEVPSFPDKVERETWLWIFGKCLLVFQFMSNFYLYLYSFSYSPLSW